MRSQRPYADGSIISPMKLKEATNLAESLNLRWPHHGAKYVPVQTELGYKIELQFTGGAETATCGESGDNCLIYTMNSEGNT